MDNKTIIGTAAVVTIGTLVYLASKDGFGAEDTKCVNGVYKTHPTPDSAIYKTANYSWATISGENGVYTVTQFKHTASSNSMDAQDVETGSKQITGIEAAMDAAKGMSPKGYIWDKTDDYCNQEETEDVPPPSNQDEEEATVVPDEETTSTDWCAVKANSPKHIKAIPSQIKSEIAKIEKEGAEELARLEARYEEAKQKCSAKEQVEEKLKDADLGEGFWVRLLAFLTAN